MIREHAFDLARYQAPSEAAAGGLELQPQELEWVLELLQRWQALLPARREALARGFATQLGARLPPEAREAALREGGAERLLRTLVRRGA